MSGEDAESASSAAESTDSTAGTTLGITLEASDEYAISYDLNVPEGEEAKPAPASYAPKTVRFGEDTPLPDGDEPTLEGYTFLGWTDMPNGGTTYGSAQADWGTWGKSEKWDKLEGATLYAQWDGDKNGLGREEDIVYFYSETPDGKTSNPNYMSQAYVDSNAWKNELPCSTNSNYKEIRIHPAFPAGNGKETGGQYAKLLFDDKWFNNNWTKNDMRHRFIGDWLPTKEGYKFLGYSSSETGTINDGSVIRLDEVNRHGFGIGHRGASLNDEYYFHLENGYICDRDGFIGFRPEFDYTWHNNLIPFASVGGSYIDGTLVPPTDIYGKWQYVSPTNVSFNPNFPTGAGGGEDVAGVYPATQMNYNGDTKTPQGYVAPKKGGFTFLGWYDAAEGGTKYLNANGTSAKMWDKEGQQTTLYGHWDYTPNSACFEDNFPTGSGAAYAGTNTAGIHPDTIQTPGAAPVKPTGYKAPAKVGWTLEGWYDAKTGSNKYFEANGNPVSGKTWDKAEGAVTPLYAHWTQKTYTISFNRNFPDNNNTTAGTQPASITLKYGDATAIPSGTAYVAPKKTGWVLDGWYDSAASNATKYMNANGTSAKAWDKDVTPATLYAHWTQSRYTITFNRNFPTGSGVGSGATANGNQPNASWTYGGACTAPSGYSAPSKVGYALEGWYSAATGGTKYMNANGTSVRSWDQEGGATLYAQWSEKSYSVSYNNNFPTGAPASSTEQGTTYAKQTDLHYSKRPANPTGAAPKKAGYTLLGWWDASSSTGGKQYLNKDGQWIADWDKDAAGETVLYARWEKATYKVTFDDYWVGAANPPEHKRTPNALSATMTFNEVAKAAGGKAPTRVGFTLLGWFDQASGGTQYLDASGKPYNNKIWDKPQDTTLYAHWSRNTYTYTFDTQGGTGDQVRTLAYVDYQALSSVFPANPTKQGYDFLGWFDSRYWGNKVSSSTEAPAQDKTYYS